MSYVLVVDDETDLLEVLVMTIGVVSHAKVLTAVSGEKALEVIEVNGAPKLIISDYRMNQGDGAWFFDKVKSIAPEAKFIVCSGNPKEQIAPSFPGAFDIVTKPHFIEPLGKAVRELFPDFVKMKKSLVTYVRVPIDFLLRIGAITFDVFIKLSDKKYVKIFSEGDSLEKFDLEKYKEKEIQYFYVTVPDAQKICDDFEQIFVQKSEQIDDEKKVVEVNKAMDFTLSLSKVLGWNASSVKQAHKMVNLTMNIMKKDPAIAKILQAKVEGEFIDGHVTILAMLTCLVTKGLGWTSEATQQKLIMAAILHDYFLTEEDYQKSFKGEFTEAYLQHSTKLGELARSLPSLPNDIDHILLQHHERPDGTGFPRKLTASKISPLAAVFIICEELVHFCFDKEVTNELIHEFWEANSLFLERDPFKKIAFSVMNRVASE